MTATPTAGTLTISSRPAPTNSPFAGAVAAEWTKFWSLRSTWWTLLAAALTMAAAAAQLAIYAVNANTDDDPTVNPGIVPVGDIVTGALDLTQYVVLALGLLAITSEYATGTIRTTMRCTPSPGRVVLAKALVVGAVTFLFGLLLGAVGTAASRPILGRWGSTPLGDTLGAVAASAAYLALVAVLALGLATTLRGAILTLTALFALLTIVPLSLQEPGITILTRTADALPSVAGRHFLAGDSTPYPAVFGLLLLAGWTATALAFGRWVLGRRDV